MSLPAAPGTTPIVFGDLLVSAVVVAAASAWLYVLQRATASATLRSKINRKIVHITCAPLAFASWCFYSDAASARYVAAVVPVFFFVRILLSALAQTRGASADPKAPRSGLARSISRGDDVLADARGGLYYNIVLMCTAVLLWKDAAASAVVLGQLCFGDGAAELAGQRFGRGTEWTFARAGGKTRVGSLAFVGAGFIGSMLLLKVWSSFMAPMSTLPVWELRTLLAVGAISVACASIELLVAEVDDNISIPAVAAVMALLLLR